MNNKNLISKLIGAAALGLLLWLFLGGDGSTGPGSSGTTKVRRGTIKLSQTERGTLPTRNATRVRSEVRGRNRIEWLVDEGKKVKIGELLVELEKTEVQRDIDQLENQLIAIETSLNSARTDLLIQQEKNKTNLEKARLSLEVAEVEKEKLLLGDIPKEERSLALSIEKAESELQRAEGLWKDMPEMLEKGFVTQDQFEKERITLKEKQDALVTAKQSQQLYNDYERPLSMKQKDSSVIEARRNVEMVEKESETVIGNLQVKVSQNERSLEESQEELDRWQSDLSQMTIYSTVEGVIFYGNPDRSWDRNEIRVGEDVHYSQTILTIPDPTEMAVAIKIHEADIDKIKEGMSAVIRSEVQKDRVFSGRVAKIDSVANAGDRRWGDQVRRFNVEVRLIGNDLDLKPGTSAEVEIDIGELEEILYVPIQAVHAEAGEFFCYLRTQSSVRKQLVEIGSSNESFLEIRGGLEEGQEILLYRPAAVESSGGEEEPKSPIPGVDGQTSAGLDGVVLASASPGGIFAP